MDTGEVRHVRSARARHGRGKRQMAKTKTVPIYVRDPSATHPAITPFPRGALRPPRAELLGILPIPYPIPEIGGPRTGPATPPCRLHCGAGGCCEGTRGRCQGKGGHPKGMWCQGANRLNGKRTAAAGAGRRCFKGRSEARRAGELANGPASEPEDGRTGEWASRRAGRRTSRRTGEQVNGQAGSRSSGQLGKRASGPTSEPEDGRAGEQVHGPASKPVDERAGERAGEWRETGACQRHGSAAWHGGERVPAIVG